VGDHRQVHARATAVSSSRGDLPVLARAIRCGMTIRISDEMAAESVAVNIGEMAA
jgi:hypothetical protein